jgi:pSer/pThr/pTyr-binding forkhead associated (FHA) protein
VTVAVGDLLVKITRAGGDRSMTCPSCGAINSADFSFCLQCGHPLAQSGQTEMMSETRADMAPVEAGTMAMEPLPATMGAQGSSAGGSRLRVDSGSVDDQFIGLDRPLTVIGRRQGSDIVIHDTNVSRMHAQIKRDGSRLVIEDTNSSNGTIVNDERIERPQELRPGDVIRIGDAVFVLEAEEADISSAEGSTMAIDLESPMTSLGAAPELIPPGLAPRQPSPLTPPPAIMDSGHTALSDSLLFEDDLSPPPQRPSTPPPDSAPPVRSTPPPMSSPVPASSTPSTSSRGSAASSGGSSSAPHGGSTMAALESLRRELSEVGEELGAFSGTLGGLADRVERLERSLDAATGDLDSVAEAISGPDAAVLMELQGILSDIERAADGPTLEEAIKVLEQLASQPRDIELLLKLSQQAGAIESALQIHGRLVAAAPRLRTSLARLTG